MDSWPRSREVEKPKPIKLRAATAATKLIQLRESLGQVFGAIVGLEVLSEAIAVLQIVAGERKA